MSEKHYNEKLSAYTNGELNEDERQMIADHLASCEQCRNEHDDIKFGSALAARLTQTDAPHQVWANIADAIDGWTDIQFGLIPSPSFGLRKGFAFAAAFVLVSAVAAYVFFNLFTGESPYHAGVTSQTPTGHSAENSVIANVPENDNTQVETNANAANTGTEQPTTDGWTVEAIAGQPKIDDGGASGMIAVGQLLETDANSRARIAVADIGTVEIAPNSRVKFVGTGQDEHRLALERGGLHAKIFAPPRLFVVDTPSGKAVDLGCEYTLNVDKAGNGVLHVTGGWVALELGGRESIVPAGMMCLMKKGKGLGTPFSADASESFRKALESFDFTGSTAALRTLLREADYHDMFTLWHLLTRVRKEDRGSVYDALAAHVPPPAGVTRERIIALDKRMLETWKIAVENAWFE